MRRIISLAVLLFVSTQLSARGQVAVTNTDDSGPGSLRQAILDLPACPRPCYLIFVIPGFPPQGYWTIEPLSPLPTIGGGSVHIDGRTQTSYGGDTNPNGPEIVLSGAQAGAASGLSFQRIGGGSLPHGDYSVRGLAFVNWQRAAATFSGTLGMSFQLHRISRIAILDNYFGVDARGLAAAPNGSAIRMDIVEDVVIAGNVISGNAEGISLFAATGVHVARNNIGMDAAQTTTIGNVNTAIRLRGVQDGLVERNVIAGHPATITVEASSRGNTIHRNQMFDNVWGIDLQNDGPTPNDRSDIDSGPNDLQNYPIVRLGGGLLRGSLDSTPSSDFDIDIYETDLPTSGQGRRYLGTITASTDPNGRARFTFAVPAGSGPYYTSTATSVSSRNTSEFSEPVN